MKIIKKIEINNFDYSKNKSKMKKNFFKIGDQIEIELKDLGKFTATVQKITDGIITFLFDDCVAVMGITDNSKSIDNFKDSSLNKWLQTKFKNSMPEELKPHIKDITIPSYEQIFGEQEWGNSNLVKENDDQFQLMKNKIYRMTFLRDGDEEWTWYWLRNKIKESECYFPYVSFDGDVYRYRGYCERGVRPIIELSLERD